ncbi:hypothetical protein PCANC_21090 [Puccinia coronata f. sp. avenae]|uniref:Uncharacterized protein n=1 Tax=Puccinia coronata f. sp. avenae TaxID=200324 RepID=A0A2N5TXA5_9BASI|nr:hypothetical protein PCANC_21090 [Puccinia coronata f. sp. avenae]
MEKDPKLVAQKESAYKHLKKTHAGASTAEPDDKVSEGAQAASLLADLITQLTIIHEPKPQFTGSHKLNVCVNPLQNTKYFELNMPRQVHWAKAIRSKEVGVTLKLPPKGPLVEFKKHVLRTTPSTSTSLAPNGLGASTPNKPSTAAPFSAQLAKALHFSLPGAVAGPGPNSLLAWPMQYTLAMNQFMNMFSTPIANPLFSNPTNNFNPNFNSSPILPNNTTSSMASPPHTPLEDTSTLDNLLWFAHVKTNSPEVTSGLSSLGITHWSMLKYYDIPKLLGAGIPDGPCHALVYCSKDFGCHLGLIARNQ